MRWLKYSFLTLTLFLLGPAYMAAYGSDSHDATPAPVFAKRNSSGMAPLPDEYSGAMIQVYAARTSSWRSHLAVHTWVATKERDADHFVVHQVIGFRARRNLPVVVSEADLPDRFWYGNAPELLADIRGEQAEKLLPEVLAAIDSYPFQDDYSIWPGPNCNTFTAYIGRAVPELQLTLPVTAIGKDYLPDGKMIEDAPSGTGYQFSLFGLFGMTAARDEGLEINILGLSAGVDFLRPALKLPGVGRVGMSAAISGASSPADLAFAAEETDDNETSTADIFRTADQANVLANGIVSVDDSRL
ncbi:MAG: DUF3750 domain-containing protein [Pseudomonadota bacterium]